MIIDLILNHNKFVSDCVQLMLKTDNQITFIDMLNTVWRDQTKHEYDNNGYAIRHKNKIY